jgi:protein-tyrosine phosphatase
MNKVIDNIMYIKDIPFYYKDICYSKLRYYLQPYVNTTYNISKITDNIYLSDMPTASNKEKLKEDGITHILCVILGMDPLYPDDFTYKNIHIRDVAHQDISEYLDECVEFIEDVVKENGKVLVHCSYGVSRSASMVLAYLIKNGMSYDEAYKLVKSKRDIIEPNPGFKKQLLVYSLEREE